MTPVPNFWRSAGLHSHLHLLGRCIKPSAMHEHRGLTVSFPSRIPALRVPGRSVSAGPRDSTQKSGSQVFYLPAPVVPCGVGESSRTGSPLKSNRHRARWEERPLKFRWSYDPFALGEILLGCMRREYVGHSHYCANVGFIESKYIALASWGLHRSLLGLHDYL